MSKGDNEKKRSAPSNQRGTQQKRSRNESSDPRTRNQSTAKQPERNQEVIQRTSTPIANQVIKNQPTRYQHIYSGYE